MKPWIGACVSPPRWLPIIFAGDLLTIEVHRRQIWCTYSKPVRPLYFPSSKICNKLPSFPPQVPKACACGALPTAVGTGNHVSRAYLRSFATYSHSLTISWTFRVILDYLGDSGYTCAGQKSRAKVDNLRISGFNHCNLSEIPAGLSLVPESIRALVFPKEFSSFRKMLDNSCATTRLGTAPKEYFWSWRDNWGKCLEAHGSLGITQLIYFFLGNCGVVRYAAASNLRKYCVLLRKKRFNI